MAPYRTDFAVRAKLSQLPDDDLSELAADEPSVFVPALLCGTGAGLITFLIAMWMQFSFLGGYCS